VVRRFHGVSKSFRLVTNLLRGSPDPAWNTRLPRGYAK